MSLRIVLEKGPHPQAEQERIFHGGTLVIGRGDEADWQINDPDMFVSRRHCILSDESGQLMITDASSGGLFIDNAANPVGTGNSVPLADGIRLRMGDFVFKVEQAADAAAPAKPEGNARLADVRFDFGAPAAPETPKERPSGLPDPFDPRASSRGKDPFGFNDEAEEQTLKPIDWENPMGLDLRNRGHVAGPVTEPGTFLSGKGIAAPAREPQPHVEGAAKYFGGGGFEPEPPRPQGKPPFEEPPVVAEASPERPERPAAITPEAPPIPAAQPAPAAPARSDSAVREALLRGMGLDPARVPPAEDPVVEAEALGARFRELVDGLVMLLRSRAQEKSRARVAQTIIANEDVNPLKFLATTEDAMAALLHPRGKGYLPPDQAIVWAYRDLADHQLRTWTALQASLRRMIDRFDPERIEEEVAELGLLEKLIAGGKSAKMWDLYEEHYRDIAKSAEEQFLGEVGADFRDAYENKRSK